MFTHAISPPLQILSPDGRLFMLTWPDVQAKTGGGPQTKSGHTASGNVVDYERSPVWTTNPSMVDCKTVPSWTANPIVVDYK